MHSGENAPATRVSSMTNPGVVMGTPRYMSPEQARGLKSGLALSRDGRRLLFAQPEPRKDEIMLMENFR